MVWVIRSPDERILGLPGAKLSFKKTKFDFKMTGSWHTSLRNREHIHNDQGDIVLLRHIGRLP